MARRGESRRPKLVRNVTIVCACLVVFIMLLERGMVAKDGEVRVNGGIPGGGTPPRRIEVDPFRAGGRVSIETEDSESIYRDEESDEESLEEINGEVKIPGEVELPGEVKIPGDVKIPGEVKIPEEVKIPGDVKGAVSEEEPEKIPTDLKEDISEEPGEVKIPKEEKPEEVKTGPKDQEKGSDDTKEDKKEGSHAASSAGETIVVPVEKTGEQLMNPDPSSTIPTIPTSPSLPHTGEEEEEHNHYHSEEEAVTKPTTQPSDKSTPPPTELSAAELEKRKNKQLELDEKAMLEAKVWKEYEDEISGVKNVTVPRDPTNPLLLSKPLLFLHIPKTAGSTLAQVFKNNEVSEKYYHFWNQPRLKELPIVPTKDTIFGHFRYGLHFYFENRTASYATMLREPVQRVISYPYYHFHLQDTQDPAHKFAVEHTFEEWLEESQAAQNEMTKSLSGIRSEFYPTNKTFEMAKHHLNKMGYVGLTERFDESLVLMKYYLGFKDLSYSDTKVGVKKPKDIAPAVIEKIRQKNWMDIILYDMAKERFEKELEEVKQYMLQLELAKI